ncbi:hypothetical protein CU102_26790 [Phyllobacterium brassicacearum]|uniref:Peptidoglycan binding-like domain-containing protein n=1 Tax=Phyllobacterium brassicacearum TaxID=314235 RepID=A0A2P7B5D1_9HYPH|nr:neuraminidase-like domain-containing protein [Phyllobacterium brassicacearum]PSH61678.1 hypothetical protein CU102_26790 [Phyllobacterium brassicacearum]TDQ12790.1 virulence plasmid A protein [Phyllobacterium brassicacearum]
MKLQRRNLEFNLRGDDVRLLQDELATLGFPISDREGHFGETTLSAVREFQNRNRIDPITGVVDARTARAINAAVNAQPRDAYRVRGRVLQPDGEPVTNARVHALEKHLRREERLGEAAVDSRGHFDLSYPTPQSPHLSLIVRAFGPRGAELAVSAVACPARPIETVDLIVGDVLRGPSEFRVIDSRIAPALESERVQPAELEPADIALLACRHEVDPQQLRLYVDARRVAEESRLPASALYGLFRQNVPARLPVILQERTDVLRAVLERAIEENQIPAGGLDDFFRRLGEIMIEQGFSRPAATGSFSLAELLATARIPRRAQEKILQHYVARQGTVEDFWTSLRASGAVPARTIDRAQLTLQLGALTGNHVPLVQALQSRHRPASTRDLAALERQDWLALIRGANGAGIPPGIPGASAEERATNYATVITATVEEAFPTAFLAARLASGSANGFAGQDEVVEFLDRNPEFAFENTRVDRYLEEHGDEALTGISDPETLRRNLLAVGRLAAIAGPVGRHEVVQPLLRDGFTSALAIDRAGAAFIARYRTSLGEARANTVFRAARQQVAVAHTLFAQFSPALHQVMPQAISPASILWTNLLPTFPDVPDWRTLFGSLDFCACEHCASVHGPAAYLVDLLAFVRNQDALPTLTASGRRRDLVEIELTCRNTETTLPYIDLVNEILGEAIAPSGGAARQTTASSEELRAQPEHHNAAADSVLAAAVYPWNLPFSRPAEEARAYLAHLGMPRHRLMEDFRPEGDDSTPTALEVAADELGLTPIERQILVDEALVPPRTLQAFWGLSSQSLAQMRNHLVRPQNFLRQSELTYAEVVELFATRFVSPGADVTIDFEEGGCNLSTAVIEPQPSQQRLNRVHRFERLRRKLGWSFYDLDRAIAAFRPGEIDNDLLVALSGFQRLREVLTAPFEEMLAWWSAIDTRDYRPQGHDVVPSLYRRVFQNPVVFDAETRPIFALDESGAELAEDGEPLADHLPSLAAALGARTEDLQLAVEADATLTVATLSELYRIVSFARALRIPVRDLLTFRRLSSHDPFASPAETLRFHQNFTATTDSGFPVTQVAYLIGHTESPGVPVAPDDTEMAAKLTRLRSALREIREQFIVVVDPEGTVTEKTLGVLLEEPELAMAFRLVRDGVFVSDQDPAAFIEEHLPFLDPASAVETLVGTDGNPTTLDPVMQATERFAFVLEPLVAHLRQTLGQSTIVQTLASEFDLSAGTLVSILAANLAGFEDETFLADDVEVTPEAFPDLFQSARRLWKSATIVSTLHLNDREVDFLITNAAAMELLDLRNVPDAAPQAAALPELFASFLQLIHVAALRRAGGTPLFDLLGRAVNFEPTDDAEAATQAFLQDLHQLTGWELDSLVFLAGGEGLALRYPEDYRNGHAVRRFEACFQALKRLGLASPHVVPGWITPGLGGEAARAIRSAAKAKYDAVQWLEVARGINDPLRERLRDALVARLLASRPEFQEVADLHGHFLIDPKMSACQLTSRIQQAIGSVQLFVQRALLNLEADTVISPEAAEEWLWMKYYRVWEANRKVFLYPENWIEPELRQDKTPLFRDFEKALLQGDVTDRMLDSAISAYVEGLASIAQPQTCAIYRDPETHTHHLFARTRELPHIYYHRRWERSRTWTPWERIPLDLEGEHLVPALMGRRFYLFWPIFQEKTQPQNDEQENAHSYHELRLAWSIWQDGQWSPKLLSKVVLTLPGSANMDRYLFRAVQRFVEPMSHGGFQGFGGGGTEPPDFSSTPRKIAIRLLPGPLLSQELGRFRFADDGSLTVEGLVDAATMAESAPHRGLLFGMAIIETSSGGLSLPTGSIDFFGNGTAAGVSHIPTLGETPGQFRIVYPHQFEGFATQSAFVYEDSSATFLVQPIQRSTAGAGGGAAGDLDLSAGIRHTHGITPDDVGSVLPLALERATYATGLRVAVDPAGLPDTIAASPFVSASGSPGKSFLFLTHYHPRARAFLSALFDGGRDGLLGRLELQEQGPASFFEDRYEPVPAHVSAPHPRNGVDFSLDGAYSAYNWELFFHVPLLVAERLRKEQRFEEAQRWFHYVFDPTQADADNIPQCYWKVRPFFEYDLADPESRPVQDLMLALSRGNPALARQVEAWREHPFDPHAIARLRPIAYQKAIVMKYLDNLIAWADSLFRQDTLETLNEATQLYILATQILGPRPEETDTGQHPPARTFNDLEESLDAFSNALVSLEDQLGFNGFASTTDFTFGGGGSSSSAPSAFGATLYFCIPKNDKLASYWDTVEDRLFKIRHCMNIEGAVRQLPLFAPPIDPGLLVQAAAAGIDISSAINDLNAPLGPYRFGFLITKALDFNAAVKALGSSLLDALTQRDGEVLARMRAAQEVELLKLVRETKQRQLAEHAEQIAALRHSRSTAEERELYYQGRPDRIDEETEHLDELESAGRAQEQALSHDLVSADAARFIPDFALGWSGMGPLTSISLGRANVLAFFDFRSREKSATATKASHQSTLAGIRGGWLRRSDEWKFLGEQATAEIRQIDQQIAAAEIREAMARKELETHDRQTAQAESVETFMREKYTNEELHSWRVAQISTLFFQSYELAYDLARRAERAFRHELGIELSSYIEFGNWDNLRKGLFSGDRLELQLRRLEGAYLNENRREYELTKHVSLALHNPLALLRLREVGSCEIELPETLFDLDCPGHYFRRIKSVSMTIPAVTGPYTTLACTLRLVRSSIRRQSTLLSGAYARDLAGDDPRFEDNFGAIQSIVTSSGQGDSGLFELSFRDERYLPFEGAGVDSRWRLELQSEFRQFDHDSISDVILHLNYTAREGGGVLRDAAIQHLQAGFNALVTGETAPGLLQAFSARHEFPTELHRFLHPPTESGPSTLALDLAQNRFPFLLQGRDIRIDQVHVFLRLADEFADADASGTRLSLAHPGGEDVIDFGAAVSLGQTRQVTLGAVSSEPGGWTFTVAGVGPALAGPSGTLDPEAIEDLLLILHYRTEV